MKIFDNYSPQQLRDAIEIELQKTISPSLAAKVAMKKLSKDPHHYESMQKSKIEKVMKEFAEGKLRSSSGDIITDRDQALAIAYSYLEKARINKYKKRVSKPGGGYVYFYDNEKKEKHGLGYKFLKFFGFNSDKDAKEKAKKDYNENNIKQRFGISLESWFDHLKNYFDNKEKWDKLFQNKKTKSKVTKKDSAKKEIKKDVSNK